MYISYSVSEYYIICNLRQLFVDESLSDACEKLAEAQRKSRQADTRTSGRNGLLRL